MARIVTSHLNARFDGLSIMMFTFQPFGVAAVQSSMFSPLITSTIVNSGQSMSSTRFTEIREECMTKISEDPRIDPRIKAVFGAIDLQGDGTADVESREQLLENAQTPEAEAQRQFMQAFLDAVNTEEVAPVSLTIKDLDFKSDPDGNQ